MSFSDALERLDKQTGDALHALMRAWERGTLTDDELVQQLAVVLVAGNRRAWALGIVALRAFVASTGRRLSATPRVPDSATDLDRLERAGRTVLDGPAEDIPRRLQRLGTGEAVDTAQRGYGAAIAAAGAAGAVIGWRRQLEGDACELCEHWAAGGEIWPADHTMPSHPGCLCTQQPVTA